MRKVIGLAAAWSVLVSMSAAASDPAQEAHRKKFDSLFIIASAGEVKFQQMVKPAEDSIAAMGLNVVPFMIDLLDTKSPRERNAIVNIMKKIGPPAIPQLATALKLPKGLAVERACMALGEIADTSSVPALNSVARHPRWRVREETLTALGKIGDLRAKEVIIGALSDSIGLVRKAAVVADGKLKLRESAAELVHMLGDDFYGARMTAAEALLKLDTPTVVQLVSDSMNSENPLVGNLGCYVLGKLATQNALEELLYQTQAGSPDRRSHAGEALIKADPKDNTGYQAACLPFETERLVLLKVQSAIEALPHDR